MKSKTNTILLAIILVIVVFIAFMQIAKSINRTTSPIPETQKQNEVIEKLYGYISKNGAIEECPSRGMMFYTAAGNGYDTMSFFYNQSGVKIGSSGGFTGAGDGNNSPEFNPSDFKNCTRVFVTEKNVWGYPAVNKYNLK